MESDTMSLRSKHGARALRCIPLIALVVLLGAAPTRAGVQVALMPAQQTVSPGAEFDVTIEVTQAGSPFNGFNAVVT